jgi:carboxyl-terminal processing protease
MLADAEPKASSASEVKAASAAPVLANDAVTMEELRRFALVFREIQRSYIEPISERELMEKAIRGMLSDLDPHSQYFAEDDFSEFNADNEGSYGGLGLEIEIDGDRLRVVGAMDETPAARAGIKTGDLIVKIDGAPMEGSALASAVERMRGSPGSDVTLTLVRDGLQAFEVKLKREVIKVSSVRARWLEQDPHLAYVRLNGFQADTASGLSRAIDKLAKEAKIDGLVLDLRGNPGGLLDAAVHVVDAFVETGNIVHTKGRIDIAKMNFDASVGDLLKGAPLVVLIDGGSASASEIVAGALKDLKRAVIVGQRSFGKGSVQSVLPLANGDGLKLTTARYYTPSGHSIQAQGIEPDIVLPEVVLSALERNVLKVSEADLAGHLDNDARTEQDDRSEALIDDFGLLSAKQILKGMLLKSAKS